MGFRFTDGGEVIEVPDDVRKEFEEREGVTVAERGPIERRSRASQRDADAGDR